MFENKFFFNLLRIFKTCRSFATVSWNAENIIVPKVKHVHADIKHLRLVLSA